MKMRSKCCYTVRLSCDTNEKYYFTVIILLVKKHKRRLNSDTHQLHTKINQYFGTHLPLSSYTIPKSAKPHKLKLLNAIGHEEFRLPQIPPELR